MRPSLENDLVVHYHVANDSIFYLGKCFHAVFESVIGNDVGIQLASK